MPSNAGFTIAAGTQHVYDGFEFLTANFPTPPGGGWKYERNMTSGSLPITTSVANAQSLSGNPSSGNPSSPYQARWKYFKWVLNATQYGGLRLASACSASSPINETDDLILNMMPIGDNTIITIDNN